jgi:hypothetical protein
MRFLLLKSNAQRDTMHKLHSHRLILLAVCTAAGTSLFSHDEPPLSRRNVNYSIEARLDPAQRSIEGREVITWRNDMKQPARELRFHLYWNAWKNNRSTWMREAALSGWYNRLRKGSKTWRGDWSWIQVSSAKVLPAGSFAATDLTPTLRYVSSDDGNADDQTVMAAPLPRAVEAGETVDIEVTWKAKIPRTFARTGFRGNYFFIVQWFPKLGVFQDDGTWNCHQFHAATEFFSDYGVYDVKMTVPAGWLLGATGMPEAVTDNRDGTTTHRYHQADVHDFAWTTSPEYREARRRFAYPGLRPVDMRLLYQPEHQGQVDRHFKATEAALRYYGTWFGEYPYPQITIIDPAWGSGADGMEYPTLFTCGTQDWNPRGGGDPEGVTVHEAGHQFWYAIVGNNEFEHAWIDEGINTFSANRVMDIAFGESAYVQRFFRGYIPIMLPDVLARRMTEANGLDRYRSVARSDVEADPTYRYFPETAAGISYSKTALWLSMLEKIYGWETLQRILKTFFERNRFRHPLPEDFFRTAEEVSGKNLRPFFGEVYGRAAVFDFAIESASSEEVSSEGFFDQGGVPIYKDGKPETSYETRVVVRRLEDGILPVDVLLRFENGEELRDNWDAQSLWKLYRVVKPAKLQYAVVDPDHKILLDVNYTNNSRTLTRRSGFATTKWASKWMFWLQDYLQTVAVFF